MKKRSCKMTSEEKAAHEFAVKVRKMTDKHLLYEFVSSQNKQENSVDDFIDCLENHTVSGIGASVIIGFNEKMQSKV